MRRLAFVVLPIAAVGTATACSGSSSPSTSAASASASASASAPAGPSSSGAPVAGQVDPCVVGTWISTQVSGTVTNSSAGISFPVAGGDGAVAVIKADGTDVVNYSAMSPETGTGNDGAKYSLQYSGQLVARLSASNGKAALRVTDPKAAAVTIRRNGKVVGTVHPPTQSNSTYTCTPGQSLTTSGQGVTLSWKPDNG